MSFGNRRIIEFSLSQFKPHQKCISVKVSYDHLCDLKHKESAGNVFVQEIEKKPQEVIREN